MTKKAKFEDFIYVGEYSEYDVKIESNVFTYTPSFVTDIYTSDDYDDCPYIMFGNDMEIPINFETATFEYPTEKDCIIKYNDSIVSMIITIHKN